MAQRTFGQRLFIVMWIGAAFAYAGIATVILSESLITDPGVYVIGGGPGRPGAIPLPGGVLQAYYGGRMTKQDRAEFEHDVESGALTLARGQDVIREAKTRLDWRAILWCAGVALAFYIPLCLLQFLFLGYGSPGRLFRSRREVTQ